MTKDERTRRNELIIDLVKNKKTNAEISALTKVSERTIRDVLKATGNSRVSGSTIAPIDPDALLPGEYAFYENKTNNLLFKGNYKDFKHPVWHTSLIEYFVEECKRNDGKYVNYKMDVRLLANLSVELQTTEEKLEYLLDLTMKQQKLIDRLMGVVFKDEAE